MNTNGSYFSLLLIQFDVDERCGRSRPPPISPKCPEICCFMRRHHSDHLYVLCAALVPRWELGPVRRASGAAKAA